MVMLLLYAMPAVQSIFPNLIDGFIEFRNKESVLYISMMEYISDVCSFSSQCNAQKKILSLDWYLRNAN